MLSECLFVVKGRTACAFIEPTRDFFPSYRLASLLRLLKSLFPFDSRMPSSVGSMAQGRLAFVCQDVSCQTSALSSSRDCIYFASISRKALRRGSPLESQVFLGVGRPEVACEALRTEEKRTNNHQLTPNRPHHQQSSDFPPRQYTPGSHPTTK
jgi:hypothetical protein